MDRSGRALTGGSLSASASSKDDQVSGSRTAEVSAERVSRGARLLYVANVAWFFRSHRMPLALEALRQGFEVHLATAFASREERDSFEKQGLVTHQVPFERSGTGLLSEARAIRELIRVIRRVKPAICHNVTIKPVIYGGCICRLLGIRAVHAISGLGYSYIAQGARARLRRLVLNNAYRVAVGGKRARVIVQNQDDLQFFRDEIGTPLDRLVLVPGSGVDPNAFDVTYSTAEPPLVVLPARMLADKGVREFVAAARVLAGRGVRARFALVGGLDPDNRAGLSEEEINQLTADRVVEYWGHQTDMASVLAQARIVCLPSYREGFPKALLEAAAAGRAIVTTDVPGCREILKPGENGLLVPARKVDELADALGELIGDADRCKRMGQRGRELVEHHFSLRIVVAQTMQVYREMLQ